MLAVAVAAACAALGTALAWLTERGDLPAARLWRTVIPLPLVIPSYVGASALLAAFAPGGLVDEVLGGVGAARLPRVDGFWGAFAVLTALSYPYVYLPVAARLAHLPPSLEESARLLGAGGWQAFRSVVLPQASGAVWAGALLAFLYVLSDFGAVQLLRYDTLTRSIYSARLFQPAVSLAQSLVLGVLALGVVVAEREVGRRRPPVTHAGARRALQVPLGAWKAPSLALAGGTVSLGLVAPLAVLAWWAGRGVVGGRTGAGAVAADLTTLARPALNTAGVSMAAALVALVAVLPVAYLTSRYRRRTAEVAHAVVVAGFALPGLVVALALAFWALQTPLWLNLYQSLPLLVFAYVVHFGAQGLRVAQVAVAAVPASVSDAARTLGAGAPRRLATVELPLMLPGLLAAGGLVLLSTMKELPATLLLAPTGFPTLATKIWNATEDGFLADAGLASLVLLAVSGLLTWLLVIRRARHLS